MIRICSLEEMQEIEAQNDASIVFHGTSSCFSPVIEERGWVLKWRPYLWDDVKFLLDVTEQIGLSHIGSIYLDVNFTCQTGDNNKGPYFTQQVDGAVQYARHAGGETVRCAVQRAEVLLSHLAGKQEFDMQRSRIESLLKLWKPLIEHSAPVVYALKACETTFPDVLPSQIGAFAYQLREWGQVSCRGGEFRSQADVPPDRIIAKAVLD
jgi:hypothetical protein